MNIETTTCIASKHLEILKQYAYLYKLPLHTFIIVPVKITPSLQKQKYEYIFLM